ncbi:cytochrome b5-like [Trichoplusia ni]|uniref:Cytochrome b5-like n=1 Tax=Trichoplusia ni TaxID=7111 RepID=A0A7E5WB82_TRINI|nr:cytochrome b5-like [Trichoplusia ni]
MADTKFTRKEIEERNHRGNAAIIIDNVVYDVTEFFDDHPGGVDVLLDNAGKDASKCFHDVGHSDIALDWRQKFVIGEVVDEDRREVLERPAAVLQQAEPLSLAALASVWGPPLLLALLAALLYSYLFP